MLYSVSIETRGDVGDPPIDDDAIDAFTTAIQRHAGTAAFGQDRPSWAATISVEHEGPALAAFEGSQIIRRLAAEAGLPAWPGVRVEAVRDDVLSEDLARPSLPDLVSGPEAASILGVSTARLHILAASHPDFPRPAYSLRAATLWLRAAIQRFGESWDRTPGRRPTRRSS